MLNTNQILSLVTLITFFVVGNPYTYILMSKLTGLKIKNLNQLMLLVAIHSIVMTGLMFLAFTYLIKDKQCPESKAVKDEVKEEGEVKEEDGEKEEGAVTEETPPVEQVDTIEGFSF